jgi:hypothetical protein
MLRRRRAEARRDVRAVVGALGLFVVTRVLLNVTVSSVPVKNPCV